MQIVSMGDNLHEMLEPIFCFLGEIRNKYFKLSSAEINTQHAKRVYTCIPIKIAFSHNETRRMRNECVGDANFNKNINYHIFS